MIKSKETVELLKISLFKVRFTSNPVLRKFYRNATQISTYTGCRVR